MKLSPLPFLLLSLVIGASVHSADLRQSILELGWLGLPEFPTVVRVPVCTITEASAAEYDLEVTVAGRFDAETVANLDLRDHAGFTLTVFRGSQVSREAWGLTVRPFTENQGKVVALTILTQVGELITRGGIPLSDTNTYCIYDLISIPYKQGNPVYNPARYYGRIAVLPAKKTLPNRLNERALIPATNPQKLTAQWGWTRQPLSWFP